MVELGYEPRLKTGIFCWDPFFRATDPLSGCWRCWLPTAHSGIPHCLALPHLSHLEFPLGRDYFCLLHLSPVLAQAELTACLCDLSNKAEVVRVWGNGVSHMWWMICPFLLVILPLFAYLPLLLLNLRPYRFKVFVSPKWSVPFLHGMPLFFIDFHCLKVHFVLYWYCYYYVNWVSPLRVWQTFWVG